jgi:hypothetical protein
MSLRRSLGRRHSDVKRVGKFDVHISHQISDNLKRGKTPAEAQRPTPIRFVY